jgi:hypothetical protein
MKKLIAIASAAAMLWAAVPGGVDLPDNRYAFAESGESGEAQDNIAYSYSRYSLFSTDISFSWGNISGIEMKSAAVASQEELSAFLKDYLTEESIVTYLKKYTDKFFEDNVLLLNAYTEPYSGRITGHEYKDGYIDDNTIRVNYTSSVSGTQSRTFNFDVMQAVIPKTRYNGQTVEWNEIEVLNEGVIQVTFIDVDTGELVDIKEVTLIPTVVYNGENASAYEDIELTAYTNPFFWEHDIKNADEFDVDVNEKSLPEGYTLQGDCKQITRYSNGSAEVVFKLKKKPVCDLAPGVTRVTLYDKDTGKLIPNDVLQYHNWMFGTDIGFKTPTGWTYTGPIYFVETNPCEFDDNLANLYRSADSFSFTGEDKPEVTLYDNGSMDLVFRTKLNVNGDLNGDAVLSMSDIVMLQKWLLGVPGAELRNWANADFDLDNRITVFDYDHMKEMLIEQMYGYGIEGYDFDAQYVLTNITGKQYPIGFPQKHVITSRDELDSYIEENQDIYQLSNSDEISFVGAAEKYTAKWFDTHKLLLVAFEEYSGLIRHEVTHVCEDAVRIKSIIPETRTNDIATWHIMIELDKDAAIADDVDIIYSIEEQGISFD